LHYVQRLPYRHTLLVEFNIVLRAMIRHIEIVREGWELRSQCVNLFDDGPHIQLLHSMLPDQRLRHAAQATTDLTIGKAGSVTA